MNRRGILTAVAVLTTALAANLTGVVTIPPTASATATSAAAITAAGWLDGANQQTQVINCPSQIFGNPYVEPGMAAKVGFYGDLDKGQPVVGKQFTYMHLVLAGLGNPCPGGTYVFPNFSLPPGVEWYKQAPINCFWNGNPLGSANCPQWEALLEGQGPNGSDAYVHPGNTSWAVTQGSITELVLPIWAPSQAVRGANLTTYLHTADGNSDPTLTPSAPLWFFPPAVQPRTCQARPVTVDISKGQRPTAGNDVILGTRRADTIRGRGGNDLVCAGGGNDNVNGGAGNDALLGGQGNDTLAGGRGRDSCNGSPGTDRATGCERRTAIP